MRSRFSTVVLAAMLGLALAMPALAQNPQRHEWIHPPRGRFVDVNGLRQHVVELGEKSEAPPIVLIHGAGCNLEDMRLALGERLAAMSYGTGLHPRAPYTVVKIPVFSFSKMRGVETILGPEMKSTGEVLGIDVTFAGNDAIYVRPPITASPTVRLRF